MLPEYAHALGGKAAAAVIRKRYIDKYYENPNHCKQCQKIIEVKENQTATAAKSKAFCNASCAAIFNNSQRQKKIQVIRVKVHRIRIRTSVSFNFLLNKTKKEIFALHKNWQSARTSIRRHAAYIYKESGKPKFCNKCGYDKHIEIAHIKSVSSFPDIATIIEINHPDNLIGLCPNCHWEFDNLTVRGDRCPAVLISPASQDHFLAPQHKSVGTT